ncbi:MAG: hypothetical protein QGF38_08660 [Rhodospirillales bacterium]|jgi:crotonobetainyl-CoA:carnitine CoA-transferase CaiB-like acyl-CoA transferase|nr:hypothetical protein [Rhodospirillales bacterium]HJO97973.1 hypothetical protein [Rhodospirillales bacterium]
MVHQPASAALSRFRVLDLTRTQSCLRVKAPPRGQDTDDVLGEAGYSADEIADLRRRDVV